MKFSARSKTFLKQALTDELGWRITGESDTGIIARTQFGESVAFDLTTGEATVRQGKEHLVDEAKRGYSTAVIREAGRRYNWALPKKLEGKFKVGRRF